ncbi:MAG: hypothetical protein AAGJ83_09325, partial [Planctomycetota bacterium]
RLPRASDRDVAALSDFVDRGGQLLVLPTRSFRRESGSDDAMFGLSWGDEKTAEDPLSVSTWRSDSDVLASTLSGSSLPVGQMKVKRAVEIIGESTPLATLADGSPLLARATTQRGGVYFCATTPHPDDSSMGRDGIALYVMIQRMLALGAASLGKTQQLAAGSPDPEKAASWKRLAGSDQVLSTENAFHEGVYVDSEIDQWIALNRSKGEDDPATVSDEELALLFDGLVFEHLKSSESESGSLVEEAWRAMLILMLIAMIGEALLCVPRASETAVSQPAMTGAGGSVA